MIKTHVIETAIDDKGDSYIFSDKQIPGWDLGGHTMTDMFFSATCPPDMLSASQEMDDKGFNLKPGQLRFFRSDIPPTKALYDALPDEEKPQNFKNLFYHSTTTVDYVMVLQGQLVMLVGKEEVTLNVGDVIIQRGAAHAWHNNTDKMATIMGVMIGVKPPKQFHRVDTIQPE